ncbi:hypothetical protein Taro_021697 [Colocasia esculenta]|uniref:Uncharacterized protein n=1 Tax=Colocasia esculenta TaxID=4460 RepID=A0A843V365_COLES|nr:hypothetical protein [Colocasia esculenta]
MARILTQSAIRDSRALIRDHPLPSHLISPRSRPPLLQPSSRFLGLRWRSGRSEKHAQILEVVLEQESGGDGGGDVGVSSPEGTAAGGEAAARRLEDVIHGILARRAAPDWLPFIPGSSYWVPPRKSYRLVEVLGRAANPLTEEEVMSLTTAQGWPCAAHLFGGEGIAASKVLAFF